MLGVEFEVIVIKTKEFPFISSIIQNRDYATFFCHFRAFAARQAAAQVV